jgi:hypothetical protein
MKIHAYFLCKNEEAILPYLLEHYSAFCNKITFFDNESIDRSINIINNFQGCETAIITNSTQGVIRDDIYLEIKNNCWKAEKVDFVIIADADEFLYHSDIISFLTQNKYDVYYPTGYNMISAQFPTNYTKSLVEQVYYGSYEPNYSKSVIFNPNTVEDINFTPGAHHSFPSGKDRKELSIYRGVELKLLHYKNLGFDYRYNKNNMYGKTLSEINKQLGYGSHYNYTKDTQYKEFQELFYKKHQVITKKLPQISFTITTCGRLDLLNKTLSSFFDLCNFPFCEYIMTDDSGDEEVYRELEQLWGSKFTIIQNSPKVGLSKSLDKLFNKCKADYIFHCEDDWLFENNPKLVEQSLDILEEYEQVHQVYVRHREDNPHKPEPDYYSTLSFVPFQVIPWWKDEWSGFSWNPGLRRKKDYLTMFPQGFAEYGDEIVCSKHTMQYAYQAVILEETSCRHIGYEQHTEGFLI